MASDSEKLPAVVDGLAVASGGRGLGFVAISVIALAAVLGAATFGAHSTALGSTPDPTAALLPSLPTATLRLTPKDQAFELDLVTCASASVDVPGDSVNCPARRPIDTHARPSSRTRRGAMR